jgi:hypothetical protein
MGDAATVLADQQPFRRFAGKIGSETLEQLHAGASAGKGSGSVEMGGVALSFRFKNGIAMRNTRTLRHAIEYGQATIVALQHPAPEFEEAFMHVMLRQRRRNSVDEGLDHGAVLVAGNEPRTEVPWLLVPCRTARVQ